MSGNFSNPQVANLLRQIAAAYALKKGNQFQIKAYETAADSIEHSTSGIKDLWEEGHLGEVPGIGESLKAHLDELFKTGKVKHWSDVKKGIPKVVFELLDIPGIGPKTALELAKLGILNIEDLKSQIKTGKLVAKGFSAKIAEKIMASIEELSGLKTGRMLLPYAFVQAEKILKYLKKNPYIKEAHALGSLRRMVTTIGDLDFSVSASDTDKAIKHIISLPGVARIINQGENKVTIMLSSGLHLDFLVAHPNSYGALLQHFTGSKHHNIHLRTLALIKGLSLSEDGVKNIKSGEVVHTKTEEELYKMLNMQTPPPEIRENTGEIEAALEHKLPKLVDLEDIKGDLHVHSNFSLKASHGPGADDFETLLKRAEELGYSYLGFSDHPPSYSTHTKQEVIKLIQTRTTKIEQIKSSSRHVRVLNLLEIDILPDGSLSVPDEGLKFLDFALAGVHSSHRMGKYLMTKRILKALENPYLKVLTHPTGRLLNERDSYEADWEAIFKFAAKNNKAMEIDAYPNRLDISDHLIREAKSYGVKFVIDTDTHALEHMDNMKFGVAVARRGWCEVSDVINTWDWKKFSEWFRI